MLFCRMGGAAMVFGFVKGCSAWMAVPGVRGWLVRGDADIVRTLVLLRMRVAR